MRRVIALSILFTLGACAATPKIADQQPIAADLSQYRAVQVEVDAPEDVRNKDGYLSTSASLLQHFVDNLRARGKYVGPEAVPGKAVGARLTITDLNYVSGAARGTAGIIAGRATISVTMTLTDKETGSLLGAVTARDESSHLQGVFSPTTERQVEAIAKELAARL